MRWMRIMILALTLSLLGWAAPETSFAEGQDSPRAKMVSGKDRKKNRNKKKIKKVRKKKGKKIRKKKKPKKKPKWSVGVRGAATPVSGMDVVENDGDQQEYDPRMAFGVGLITQYRIFDKPSIYILGEFTHWWHELKNQTTSEKDSLITVSAGVRFNVWGQANKARDRVFVKALVGYTYYAANNKNSKGGAIGGANRSGIYFGGGVGLEHLFKALPLSVFVDTGIYNHNFSIDPAKGEKESSLLTWEIGAGILYHF